VFQASIDVGIESTQSGIPENMGVAVGTASLFTLERDIDYFRLCRSPSCFSVSGDLADVGMVDIENIQLAVGILFVPLTKSTM
jgi:hypothetical protein